MRNPRFSRLFLITSVFLCGSMAGAATLTMSAGNRGSDIFPDVLEAAYYNTAIGTMAEIGVIRGNPDGTYRPDAYVTRADVAVMMDRLRNDILGLTPETARTVSPPRRTIPDTVPSEDSTPSETTPAPEPNAAGAVRFTIDHYSVSEDEGTAKITLIRTGGKKGLVSVRYTLSSGTAAAGADYIGKTDKLTFIDGESTRIFTVDLLNDGVAEDDETLTIILSDPQDGVELGIPSSATLTIVDDETPDTTDSSDASVESSFAFGSPNYSMAEDESGVSIYVHRMGDTSGTASVEYATKADTANSSDYTHASGTIQFADGETEKFFTVSIQDDSVTEGNEKVLIIFSDANGAGLPYPATITLTIVDDEVLSFTEGELNFSEESYDAQEDGGTVTLKVQRKGGARGEISVQYETENGNAKSGTDFAEARGTLTFRAGETEKMITVPIIADEGRDPNESFRVTMFDPTGGAALGTNEVIVTIRE